MRTYLSLVLLLATAAQAETITSFQAVINNSGAIASDGVTTSTETGMTGVGTFILTEPTSGTPTLSYDLQFLGIDFTGTDGDLENDVTAIHIHDTTGTDASAGTAHVLNIFGAPSTDDADYFVDSANARVTGVWDDGDLTDSSLSHAGNPQMNSDTLTSMLTALKSGELYVMLHTTSPRGLVTASGATIGGQILSVPEPAGICLALLGCIIAASKRSKR